MKRALPGLVLALVAVAVILAPLGALAASNDRWLHVRVEKTAEKGESVRVNVPLAVAEKVLPAITAHEMEGGRLKIHDAHIEGIDIRAVLEAMRTLGDGEFVTIESNDENIRVAKQGGYLIAKVDDRKGKNQRVDVKIPFAVVDALLSGAPDELNILAAVQALGTGSDEALVTVESDDESVRVWVDSKATTE